MEEKVMKVSKKKIAEAPKAMPNDSGVTFVFRDYTAAKVGTDTGHPAIFLDGMAALEGLLPSFSPDQYYCVVSFHEEDYTLAEKMASRMFSKGLKAFPYTPEGSLSTLHASPDDGGWAGMFFPDLAIAQMKFDEFAEKMACSLQATNAAACIPAIREGISKGDYKPAIEGVLTEKTTDGGALAALEKKLGGFYAGLYCIGAGTGVGKTALVMQIADNFAFHGVPVLYFSLEMSRAELITRSVARLTFYREEEKKVFATRQEVARGEAKPCIAEAWDYYTKSIAPNMYIYEGNFGTGVEEIGEQVAYFIRTTEKRPLVVVDYFQALTPLDAKASDKQNADVAIKRLKQISRDNNICVIAISSVSRQSEKDAKDAGGNLSVSAFRDSSTIEYSCDVCLLLNRLKEQEEGHADTRINLRCAKGRFCGPFSLSGEFRGINLFYSLKDAVKVK